MGLEIDEERLRETFDQYSSIGATENDGLHRLALSDEDQRVRDRFVDDLESLGLSVRIDELGNVFGRQVGADSEAAPVMIGSHLDSQPYGGRYDGQLGVLAALETLRTFDDHGIRTERPIEIVNWTNEEGGRFPQPLMGSGVYTGQLSKSDMLSVTDDEDRSVAAELERIGYDGPEPCKADNVHSFLELHIEQGPKLERREMSVGIVEGVFGMAWLEATIRGESDHAGPTPMYSRSDALAASADAISAINALPNRLSEDAVTTVGKASVSPNSINVIPDNVTFSVDVRSYDDAVVDRGIELIEAELAHACDRHGVNFKLEKLWHIPHTEFAKTVASEATAAAQDLDVSHCSFESGAGHDAKYLNDVTDAGMIFVPSVDGKTHSEDEYTEWEDVCAGTAVFAETTRRLANG